ncbi:MAG: TrmH family RNA methyltransferase [Candidatus Fonsibacter sp.]
MPRYSHKTVNLFHYEFDNNVEPIFLFGEENRGLSDFILDRCHIILTINNYGSVRSLNVGTTSGVVMSVYRNYLHNRNQ